MGDPAPSYKGTATRWRSFPLRMAVLPLPTQVPRGRGADVQRGVIVSY